MDVVERCLKCGIVPVVVIENADDAVDTAKALLAGGIDCMEVTMRTDAALESVRRIAKEVPEMLVGAGTVLNLDACKAILEAGANFIVSPGFDPATVDYCVENNVPILPGVATPTEIMMALCRSLKLVKFFPANIYGGLKAMKALSGPFVGLKFLPTGGVNGENIKEYIEAPFIAAVGGSWVCTKADISSHNYAKITELSKAARDAIDEVRA